MMASGICLQALAATVNAARFWIGFTERENLHKVGGSEQRLATVEAWLWKGDVDTAIAQFAAWQHERVDIFIAYLRKHRERIVNYGYFHFRWHFYWLRDN